MNIREMKEKNESEKLSEFACRSAESEGRAIKEEPCDIRTCFERDRDRILHSKAFRRLMHKTQVFISPEGDHYRTRLTHTLEVSQIARTIASALNLNENLTEAIALGHDLGHTPFEHNKQSVRVVSKIEKNGEGLNLSKEVLDGILNHRGKGKPKTLEGKIVQISDKIAYVNHDIEDAIRAGIISEGMLPKNEIELLGRSAKERIDFLIRDIIKNSYGKNDIKMTEGVKDCLYSLRDYMFENVYKSKALNEEKDKYINVLKELFKYYKENYDKVPSEFKNNYKNEKGEKEEKERIIADYLAGMTDRFARNKYNEIKK